MPAFDSDDMKEPKATRWNLRGAQTLLRLELLFGVLDTSLRAIMVMITDMVVEDILCVVCRPLHGIRIAVLTTTEITIGQEKPQQSVLRRFD